MSLAWQSRGNPEAGQPHPTGRRVDQDVRRLDVFMDDAVAVCLAQSARKTNGELQEEIQLHRRFDGPRRIHLRFVQQSLERLAWLVLEYQGRTALILPEGERPHRPRRIQLAPQRQFVL